MDKTINPETDLAARLDTHSVRVSSVLLDAAHHACTLNMPHDVYFYMKTMYEHEAKMRTVFRRISQF